MLFSASRFVQTIINSSISAAYTTQKSLQIAMRLFVRSLARSVRLSVSLLSPSLCLSSPSLSLSLFLVLSFERLSLSQDSRFLHPVRFPSVNRIYARTFPDEDYVTI